MCKRGQFVSENFKCEKGTRRGCNLSPTLFKIYINDLQDIFNAEICNPVKVENRHLGCLMYTDDVVVLSERATGLQNHALNELNNYCRKWALTVNARKKKVMVFNSRQCRKTLTIGNKIILTEHAIRATC